MQGELFEYGDPYESEKAAKDYEANEKARRAAERQQSKEVDAKEEAYRKKNNIGPEVRGYQHMDAEEKARARKVENEDFKDKRTPKSDLIRQAELEKMKEILNTPKPKGVSGGSGSMGTGKMNRDITKAYKKGGTASSRADGCAQRGKTKGRMI